MQNEQSTGSKPDETIFDGTEQNQDSNGFDYDSEAQEIEENQRQQEKDDPDARFLKVAPGKRNEAVFEILEEIGIKEHTDRNGDPYEKAYYRVKLVEGKVAIGEDEYTEESPEIEGDKFVTRDENGKQVKHDLIYGVTRSTGSDTSQWAYFVDVGQKLGGLKGEKIRVERTGKSTDTSYFVEPVDNGGGH